MPFLLPNQWRHQRSERNAEHWFQPRKITHWSYALLIYKLIREGKDVAAFTLDKSWLLTVIINIHCCHLWGGQSRYLCQSSHLEQNIDTLQVMCGLWPLTEWHGSSIDGKGYWWRWVEMVYSAEERHWCLGKNVHGDWVIDVGGDRHNDAGCRQHGRVAFVYECFISRNIVDVLWCLSVIKLLLLLLWFFKCACVKFIGFIWWSQCFLQRVHSVCAVLWKSVWTRLLCRDLLCSSWHVLCMSLGEIFVVMCVKGQEAKYGWGVTVVRQQGH